MDHQDWDTFIINNKSKSKVNEDGSKKKEFVKSKEHKFEEQIEEGKMSHKRMDAAYGKELQKKRLSRGMTQKDLANKINVPFKLINDIESGKAKHNGPVMNKLNRLFQ
tara:strand:- start:2606 stop:2929 length:324 start_codon:yes stop_codon:yes gene_type:complete